MKTHLLIILSAMNLLTACDYVTGQPPADDIKKAVAELRKIDPATIRDFKKESCRKGTISFMFNCTFNFSIEKDGKVIKSDFTEARLISQDGTTWTAYEK